MAEIELPRAVAAIDRFGAKLGLERGANLVPVSHIFLYFGYLAICLSWGFMMNPAVIALSWFLLHLSGYSLTIGVLHTHAHRPLFTHKAGNWFINFACSIPCFLTFAEMRTVHVLHHHKYDDREGDITSTIGTEKGLKALWYWVSYGVRIKAWTIKTLFSRDATAIQRKMRSTYLINEGFAILVVTVLSLWKPIEMVIFWVIPMGTTLLTTGYFAWLTHAPAREIEGKDASINNVGNVLNFFVFNQGYHSVHHRYPGIHWTEIPDHIGYMTDAEPGVIVRYWMTLDSTWRVLLGAIFRQPEFGKRWQKKLERRLENDDVRRRGVPWFVRV